MLAAARKPAPASAMAPQRAPRPGRAPATRPLPPNNPGAAQAQALIDNAYRTLSRMERPSVSAAQQLLDQLAAAGVDVESPREALAIVRETTGAEREEEWENFKAAVEELEPGSGVVVVPAPVAAPTVPPQPPAPVPRAEVAPPGGQPGTRTVERAHCPCCGMMFDLKRLDRAPFPVDLWLQTYGGPVAPGKRHVTVSGSIFDRTRNRRGSITYRPVRDADLAAVVSARLVEIGEEIARRGRAGALIVPATDSQRSNQGEPLRA